MTKWNEPADSISEDKSSHLQQYYNDDAFYMSSDRLYQGQDDEFSALYGPIQTVAGRYYVSFPYTAWINNFPDELAFLSEQMLFPVIMQERNPLCHTYQFVYRKWHWFCTAVPIIN